MMWSRYVSLNYNNNYYCCCCNVLNFPYFVTNSDLHLLVFTYNLLDNLIKCIQLPVHV